MAKAKLVPVYMAPEQADALKREAIENKISRSRYVMQLIAKGKEQSKK